MSDKTQVTLPTIAMLGAGSMARAILAGLLAPHVSVEGSIRVTNRSAENAAKFDSEPRVQAWATANDPDANSQAVAGAQIVLVAVKPAMVPDRRIEKVIGEEDYEKAAKIRDEIKRRMESGEQ